MMTSILLPIGHLSIQVKSTKDGLYLPPSQNKISALRRTTLKNKDVKYDMCIPFGRQEKDRKENRERVVELARARGEEELV